MSIMSIEAEKANTNGERIKGNSFSKKMRDVEINGFVKGDYFTIPDTFEVREIVYPNGRAEYIFVTVNGTNDVKKFFPSMMWKRRLEYKEEKASNGEVLPVPIGWKHTTGKAAEDFLKFGTVQEAMENLKGKTLVIADVEEIRTVRYGTTNDMITTNIYTIEYKTTSQQYSKPKK